MITIKTPYSVDSLGNHNTSQIGGRGMGSFVSLKGHELWYMKGVENDLLVSSELEGGQGTIGC